MQIRLQKILAQAGICSRRKAEEYILAGEVTVNGKPANRLGLKADPEQDRIVVSGRPVKLERHIYLMLNKPKGYLCTAEDTDNRNKVLDLVKGVKERLFTIGRLDKDTEGLLLLTNDGIWAHRLMHPSYEKEKTYRVVLDKGCSAADKRRLERGIVLDGRKTGAARIKLLAGDSRVLLLTIHEGRKRQIRRLFFCLGYEVVRLKRVQYAGLSLGNLKPGQVRFLTQKEVSFLAAGKKTFRPRKENYGRRS